MSNEKKRTAEILNEVFESISVIGPNHVLNRAKDLGDATLTKKVETFVAAAADISDYLKTRLDK